MAYATRDEFIDALVPILHDELVALQATGVSVVQIDEPHLCVLVDPKIRAEFDDPQYEMDLAAAKINEVIHGVNQVRLAMHLCRRNWGREGWGAEGGYGPIVETLKKIKVDQYVMEFSIPAAGDVAILKGMPEDSLIGLGSVGVPVRARGHPGRDCGPRRGGHEVRGARTAKSEPRLRLLARQRGIRASRGGVRQAEERGGGCPPAPRELRLAERLRTVPRARAALAV